MCYYYLNFAECDCNGLATRCVFDESAFIKSSNVSGGVCVGCRANTAGEYISLLVLHKISEPILPLLVPHKISGPILCLLIFSNYFFKLV